jgi:uncharacterized cysteine cluster protein YcgN (CxxCxxCC family)
MTHRGKSNTEKWESVCSRCGQCCYEKIDFENRIYYTALPCEYLDLKTKHCRIYNERDKKRPGCVRLTPENIRQGFLPADCAYVADIENYPAPVTPEDEDGTRNE